VTQQSGQKISASKSWLKPLKATSLANSSNTCISRFLANPDKNACKDYMLIIIT